ncbi:FAD-binding domain-containing protein, partial [Penicillium cf. griseofulvum]
MILFVYLAVLLAAIFIPQISEAQNCRCLPQDPCWPSPEEWKTFNDSIDGNLVSVKPVGHVCHGPKFDNESCESVISMTHDSSWRASQPGALQWYNWENWPSQKQSCYPERNISMNCDQGRISLYSAMVKSVEHIQKSIEFAKDKNLRVAIRNTGHDLAGRSSAPNSFQIFTNGLKDIQYVDNFFPVGALDYNSKSHGPAVTIGAGVLVTELYAAAAAGEYTVVAGISGTVGVAGGLIQGGGISILSPLRGLASDNALQFEVVTADGELVIANQDQNQDLFWALRGGGGGTFGVVVSVTIRVYPDIPVTVATLNITTSTANDKFWTGTREVLAALPALREEENSAETYIMPRVAPTNHASLVVTIYSFGQQDKTLTDDRFSSLLASLNDTGIPYIYSSQSVPKVSALLSVPRNLKDAFTGMIFGSVLASHDFITSPEGPSHMVDIFSSLQLNIGDMISLRGGKVMANKDISSAANPDWRTASLDIELGRVLPSRPSWESQQGIQDSLTNLQMPLLRSLESGRMGAYLNMADPREKDFQLSFWGDNYGRLYEIKQIWDKNGLFITRLGVGSEDWDEDGMCRIAALHSGVLSKPLFLFSYIFSFLSAV